MEFLPPFIGKTNNVVKGLNARFRVYKYNVGSIYRPHLDGAWPGSGFSKDTGEYEYDAFGDRWSKLTFLLRLNQDFKGGATTFYTPSSTVGQMDARSVYPGSGDCLVFPHGETKGTLLHEGSPVLEGVKYVIRTEVLYLRG